MSAVRQRRKNEIYWENTRWKNSSIRLILFAVIPVIIENTVEKGKHTAERRESI